jgi:protein SCO1/2
MPILMTALLLAGCSGDDGWRTKDITGIMPDLELSLTGEDGTTITEQAFRGEPLAVYFGYTHCPDICPATLGKLRLAIGRLPEDEQNGLRVLFISVDPRRDDPSTLAEYTRYFGPQFVGATADQRTLEALARRYRATFGYGQPDAEGDYTVSHPSAVYVFDGQGHIRLLMRGDDPPEAMAHDFAQLMEQAG